MYQLFLSTILISTSLAYGIESRDFKIRRPSYRKIQKKELLYIIHAKGGQLCLDPYIPDQYTLTLTEVDKAVTYFSERPQRKKRGGGMPMEEFLKIGSFKKDAGLISILDSLSEGRFSDASITLMHPHYEKEKNRLIFEIKVSDKDPSVGDLGEVTLFIDQSSPLNY